MVKNNFIFVIVMNMSANRPESGEPTFRHLWQWNSKSRLFRLHSAQAVSYTHLDVYKRQPQDTAGQMN